jgi:hypothetical protein
METDDGNSWFRFFFFLLAFLHASKFCCFSFLLSSFFCCLFSSFPFFFPFSGNAPNAPPEYGHEGEGEEGFGESEGEEGEGETLPSAPPAVPGVPGVEPEDEYEFVPKETAGGGTWETDAHVWEIEVPMRSLLPTTTAKDVWMFKCVNAFFVEVKFSGLTHVGSEGIVMLPFWMGAAEFLPKPKLFPRLRFFFVTLLV